MESKLFLFLNKTKPKWISWNLHQTSACPKINKPEQNWKIETFLSENTISSGLLNQGFFYAPLKDGKKNSKCESNNLSTKHSEKPKQFKKEYHLQSHQWDISKAFSFFFFFPHNSFQCIFFFPFYINGIVL